MKKPLTFLLCLLAVFPASYAVLARGQAADAGPQAKGLDSAKLEPVKQLRKGVDAWPLIVNPANPAEERVNATLTRLNLRLAKAVSGCVGSWLRKVKVTMEGPRLLSLVANDEIYCGGAHPQNDTMAMVFDMTTGAPVNWPAMVAASKGASTYSDTVSDGATVGALVLPALAKLNAAAASDDCKDAFRDQQSFQLWPDAKSGALVAMAFDLPHAAAVCAVEIPLTLEQARDFGFDGSLLSAIEQAHRQFADAPNPAQVRKQTSPKRPTPPR